VADTGEANVSMINDTNASVNWTFPVGNNPYAVAPDYGTGMVYVANYGSNNVSVLNPITRTERPPIRVGGSPEGLAYDPAKGEVFVANYGTSSVSVINDTNDSVVATILVRGDPVGAAYDAARGEVFIGDYNQSNGPSSVSIINDTTDTVVGTVPVAEDPLGVGLYPLTAVCYDGLTGEVFVTNPGANSVSVISDSSDTVVATVGVGTYPEALSFDSAAGAVWVVNADSGNVSIINGTTNQVEASVALGSMELGGISYDAARSEAFVANVSSDSVVIIPANLSVGAALSPSRYSADVGQPVLMSTSTIGEPSSYSYSYTAPSGFGCAPLTGPFTTCTPSAAGNYTVSVRIADVLGGTGTAVAAAVRVYLALAGNLTLSNSSLWLGDTLLISGNATGGLPPYSYNFTNLPPGCLSTGSSQIGCLPTQSDNYSVHLQVRDSNNWTALMSRPLSISFDFIILSPANATTGQSIVIRVEAAPGFGGLHYSYSGLPPGPGCTSSNEPTVDCTPTQPGTYSIAVSVADQSGHHANHTTTLHVVQTTGSSISPAGLLGLPGSEGYVLLASVGIAVVVGIAVAFRVSTRSGAREKPGDERRND
jgi:YVTN family beta-propeller protein